jgi:hemoglobin/transferrin/lactoferrin receptor protein
VLTHRTPRRAPRAPTPAAQPAATPPPRVAALTALAAAAALLACAPLATRAQTAAAAPTPPAATPLAEIVNIVTRTERAVDAVPATVTVDTAEQIEQRGARDLKDLLRHEVDVTVRSMQPRFGLAIPGHGRGGNEGINIRGLEGNQVLILVDGIRLPQRFQFGHAFITGRVDYLLLDGAQTIEVLRGPASAQFGSDGLAGALSVRTVEPQDLLRPGRDHGGFARVGGTTLDDSRAFTVAGAWQGGGWSALLLGSHRQGHETDNQGRNEAADERRTAPNPLDYRQRGLLAKLRHQWTPAHQVGLTLETVRRHLEVEALSARAVPPTPPAVLPATAVIDLDARDRVARDRASLEWTYDDVNATLVQRAEARLYVQDASTRQHAWEDRHTAPDRTRDNRYRERLVGLSAQAQASVGGALPQRLSAGVDASQARVTGMRDGTVPPPGETFPRRAFPDTDYRLFGAFVQSEVEAGALTLIPALRFDRYELDASAEGFHLPVASTSGQALTPRLGALWQVTETLQAYGQWARGFRAPEPGQVNTGFHSPVRHYRSIGNPDLRPERAQSFELGLRGRSEGLRWQVAAYDNRYRNFIISERIRGNFTLADPAIFQSINADRARIRGAEARLHWQAAPGWQFNAAAAYARGHLERAGVERPLDTIEPARFGAGLRHERGAWQWRADVLHVRAKSAARIAHPRPPAPPFFAPPGYTVVDVGASWRVHRDVTLHFNVENLFDQKYWRWSDVRGIPATSAVLDAFTAPGRSFNVAARIDF